MTHRSPCAQADGTRRLVLNGVAAAVLCAASVHALEPTLPDGTPPDRSGLLAAAEVALDWRVQNLVALNTSAGAIPINAAAELSLPPQELPMLPSSALVPTPQLVLSGQSLDLGGAIYIDCGATEEYRDTLGRVWLPDAPFLVTTGALIATFGAATIDDSLLGDRFLPNIMLNSERWFNSNILYEVPVPNGWYTVLLYFSENWTNCVGPAFGGTGCDSCARVFDVEVEGQRVNAYNQADAAVPPGNDGVGAVFIATQLAFTVLVTDGQLDIMVIDRGDGNPPEDASIKGIAILMRPPPPTIATPPRIASLTLDNGQHVVLVDPQANLARYLAGDLPPLRLQSSPDFSQWTTLTNPPQLTPSGLFFSLPAPTISPWFYRSVIIDATGLNH